MPDQMKELKVVNATGKVILYVDGKGRVKINDKDGKLYALFQPAMLLLYEAISSRNRLSININALAHVLSLRNTTGSKSTVSLDGKNSEMRLRKNDGKDTVWLDGKQANIWLGGNGCDGDILLFPRGTNVGNYDGISANSSTIHLDGDAGDIKLRNADLAEDFEVMHSQEVEPGSVVVIEQDAKLRQSTEAYDKRVAGVISGAGDNNPGIVLGRSPSNGKMMTVALSGKVYCNADAGQSPIQVGDLLTTSDNPGYAMKATDPTKAFGAVIGKALRPLKNGQGLIPILVALQ